MPCPSPSITVSVSFGYFRLHWLNRILGEEGSGRVVEVVERNEEPWLVEA